MWILIDTDRETRNLAVGVYYGPQENDNINEVQRQMGTISTQILELNREADIVLTGDFNAKLEINRGLVQQEISRNGVFLQQQ